MTRGEKISLFCNWGGPGENNVQEGGVFLHEVCAVCSTDLQLYIPLMLPCFIDQGPWGVARDFLMKIMYWPLRQEIGRLEKLNELTKEEWLARGRNNKGVEKATTL